MKLENIKVNFNLEISGENVVFDFKPKDEMKTFFICTQGIELELELNENSKCISAKRVDLIDIYLEKSILITELFIDSYNESVNNFDEDLVNGIEPTDNFSENVPKILVPYDPNSIRVTQGRFSLKEIYEMINGDEFDEAILDLSPDFQRNFVWDNRRKSRLIESILLQIPLPVFYLARDVEGKYQVVDGVQRLSVINEFFSNGFKLKDLEYLKVECENKFFQKNNKESLHPKFVRNLRSYQIDCNIIEPDTPYKVKLDIFKRLNTGGRSLNNQEVRNSIFKKTIRNFIRRLSESKEFISATSNSIRAKRMADQELILRYIGFYFLYKKTDLFPNLKYSGAMDEFLDEVTELLNASVSKKLLEDMEEDFYLAMNNAHKLFGEYAFRKVDKTYLKNSRKMINKSLFTSFSVLLSNYSSRTVTGHGDGTYEFSEWLFNDHYLYDSITYGTNDKARIDTTFMQIQEFLEMILGGSDA